MKEVSKDLVVTKAEVQQEAFDKAVKVIGRQDMLESEYKKVRPFSWITFKSWVTKWFINLRGEENLTESQKRYIKRWSFGPILWFLYAPFRHIWYVFGFFTLLSILINFITRQFPVSNSWNNFYLDYGFILFRFIIYILFGWLGRRLSWNKGNWKTYQRFQKSELIWNIFGLIILLLFFYYLYRFPVSEFIYRSQHPLYKDIFPNPYLPRSASPTPFAPLFRSPLFPGP
jgi:hypothetical protein